MNSSFTKRKKPETNKQEIKNKEKVNILLYNLKWIRTQKIQPIKI